MKRAHHKPIAERYQTAITVGGFVLLVASIIFVFGVLIPPAPNAINSPASKQEKRP